MRSAPHRLKSILIRRRVAVAAKAGFEVEAGRRVAGVMFGANHGQTRPVKMTCLRAITRWVDF